MAGPRRAGARRGRLRAGGRPDHARHHPAPQPDVRHADRPRGHLRARVRARRHRRLDRGGGRLLRALPHRGADEPGPAAGADPQPGVSAGGPGDPAPARVRGPPPLHGGDQPLRERRRPRRARGARESVRGGDRPHAGHPLEGHLRTARGRDRRHRARREHPRGHHHQEHVTVDQDIVLWIVVGTALAFDFTNGFHDTANAVATSISTRALSPKLAVAMAALLNFVGAFLSLEVAATIATGIVNADLITEPVVFAGLVGAIAWNLATWYWGLPSSSSHALIGGVVGAAFVAEGPEAVYGSGLVDKVIVPALVAPFLAFVAGGLAILVAYRIVGRVRPGPVNRGFRLGQLISASLLALSHGTNDAQKTMGIIFLALVANGSVAPDADVPTWVVVSAATAIALGTYAGGWRIIRTMGSRIIKMDPAQGFAAQG